MRAKLTSPKIIALLGAVAVGLVAAVGWFGLVSPQKSRSSELDAQISDVTAQVQLVRIAARANRDEAKLTEEKLRRLAAAMPNELQMSKLMRELLWNARRAGVRLDSVTPAVGTTLSGYVAVPVDVAVTGRYFGVEHFLKRLRLQAGGSGDRVHATGRLLDVAKVGFQPADGDAARITATLHLNVFVYNPAPPAAGVAAPVSGQVGESPVTESATAVGRMP
jgi:hypothetical protein